MQAVLQRVNQAKLVSGDNEIREIGRGIVVLVGIEKNDDETAARRMAKRLLEYRLFPDLQGRMNLSVSDINGEILLVPNFTIAANTQTGTRAGFSTAAAGEQGQTLFKTLFEALSQTTIPIKTGYFGADMQITLTNDGPVTFILNS